MISYLFGFSKVGRRQFRGSRVNEKPRCPFETLPQPNPRPDLHVPVILRSMEFLLNRGTVDGKTVRRVLEKQEEATKHAPHDRG